MIRFHFLTGDSNWQQYGGKWISNPQSNGEFTYYFVIELINWEDAVGAREAPAKYNVTLSVVSPTEAGRDNLKSAAECCGISLEDPPVITDEIKVELLHAYGAGVVPVWQENNNNYRRLLQTAKKVAREKEFFFGFAMDRPVNRIGTTGWDALRGDLMAGLNHT